ncbi:MAG TPA: preprotein translocase subunit SecA [Bryobacteraceae bacterium]|jgi:preprotein translocase subunit SecA|nr:preprotein translocase subunit SecA [Bryobacteraceae bacterium]
MFEKTLEKIFGTKHGREIKKLRPIIAAINDLEPQMQALSMEELAAQTVRFREQLAQGASLDDLLIPAFATVREAGRRVLNMRHFDVQLIGGITLHRGKIAEMKTGEGKTLVATLPVYLNALEGKGVHVVTVNDYLARRDAEWMGRIYKTLGMSVGVIVHDLDDMERRAAYAADITYGTNNEFGFDYLRDNMKFRLADCVQRGHNFAIIDEVDSILIDEARTPLIISGPSEESTDKYYKINRIIPRLVRGEVIEGKEPGQKYTTGDYTVDEKFRSVALTEEGSIKVEKLLGLSNMYDAVNMEINHHVQQALKAHVLFQRDRDYVVKDGEVIIVDEFTGRLMPGRRWSDGLHQAVEAKEGVKIQRENQTLATITFQNYFRMYKKLAGMTGTADTEAAEFDKIYKLDVTIIPTNKPLRRIEFQDIVYRTEEEKFRNAAKEIKACYERGQPVLVGTVSVAKSEILSGILKKMGVPHEVLNAKNHEREAFIIAQAGRKGAVTVSTNMAGRGTDILLGGNPEFSAKEFLRKQNKDPDYMQTCAVGTPERTEWDDVYTRFKNEWQTDHDEVVALGGLHIVGTERHESRRIDNQLRGRAGRQGDPGSARFYLSLQDDLMRIFGGQRMQNLMLRLGMEEDVPIESKLITKRIAAAQKAVEAQHFASRKHILEYDDVMNKQRQAVYGMRRALLEGQDQKERIVEIIAGILGSFIDARCPEKTHPSQWDWTGLETDILTQFGVKIRRQELESLDRRQIEEEINQQLLSKYAEKEAMIGAELMRETERMIMLNVIDNQWKDHLLSMDHLKEGIGLRGYGQKDPLVEYKKESFILFQDMMDRIEDETIRWLFFMQRVENPELEVPHPDVWSDEDEDEGGQPEPVAVAANPAINEAQRQAAQNSVLDLTRNIQRKKEKEMAALQFAGGETSAAKTPVIAKHKAGRNDPCPCGSGKKYKKCCGAQ